VIPVRVPADAPPHTVGGIRTLSAEHPLHTAACPVCDGLLADQPITLVFVGIHPEDRKASGWTTGGAVAVHAACAGIDAATTAPKESTDDAR